ncbi:hypothetical protein D3C81_2114330 [compost metagenome]
MPSPRQWLFFATIAAARPVLWVIEPVICDGHTGARSSPMAGIKSSPSKACNAARAQTRPARNSACRLATERWMLAGGSMALR